MLSQKSLILFLLFIVFTQMASGMPSRNRYPDGQPNREAHAQSGAQFNSDEFDRRVREQEEVQRREEARQKELEDRNRIEEHDPHKENRPPAGHQSGGRSGASGGLRNRN